MEEFGPLNSYKVQPHKAPLSSATSQFPHNHHQAHRTQESALLNSHFYHSFITMKGYKLEPAKGKCTGDRVREGSKRGVSSRPLPVKSQVAFLPPGHSWSIAYGEDSPEPLVSRVLAGLHHKLPMADLEAPVSPGGEANTLNLHFLQRSELVGRVPKLPS